MTVLDVFVSYRTADTGILADEVAGRLKGDLGLDAVYYAPVDNRTYDDWAENVLTRLERSQVVVALVGPHWTNCVHHDEHHANCVFDDADWVRREVAFGLSDPETVVLPVAMGVGRVPDDIPDDVRKLSTTQGIVLDSPMDDAGYEQILTGCWLSLKKVDDDTMIVVSDGSDEAEIDINQLVAQLKEADLIESSRLSATVNDPQGLRAIPLRKGAKAWPKVIAIAPRTRRDIVIARLAAATRLRKVQTATVVGGTLVAAELGVVDIARESGVELVRSSVDAVASSVKTGPWSSLGVAAKVGIASVVGISSVGAIGYLAVEVFDGQEDVPEVAREQLSWASTVIGLRGSEGTYSFLCPPGGSPHVVWGDVIYTDDSSVCTAAVHAGLISFEDGGEARLSILDGMESYSASERNGVSTRPWPAWPGSFVFLDE